MRELGMAAVRRDLTQLVDDIRMAREPIMIKDYRREVAVLMPVELAKELLSLAGSNREAE